MFQSDLENNNNFFNSLDSKFGIKLNDAQKEAVLNEDDVLQIIAGAGTGKTTTLVSKVKYLVEQKGVSPEKILCLSFSRDSADDLRKKVKEIGLPASKKQEMVMSEWQLSIVLETVSLRKSLFQAKLQGFLENSLKVKLLMI